MMGSDHMFPRESITPERIQKIRQMKKDNPTAPHRVIAMLSFDSVYAVEKALKEN